MGTDNLPCFEPLTRERKSEREWKLAEEAGFGNENGEAKGVFKVVLYILAKLPTAVLNFEII